LSITSKFGVQEITAPFSIGGMLQVLNRVVNTLSGHRNNLFRRKPLIEDQKTYMGKKFFRTSWTES
jgi:hypothetical protein